jgi:hypothetical protein
MECFLGQRVRHEQFGLGRVTGNYTNDFETNRRYDVVFDTIRGFKTVLAMYLTDAEPRVSFTEKPTINPTEKSPLPEVTITMFDASAARQAKEEDMALAANTRTELLNAARFVARKIAAQRGEVYMDLVSEELAKEGLLPEHLGNAAGSVFRGAEWVFTGKLHSSARKDRHAGAQRIWVNTSVTRTQVAA